MRKINKFAFLFFLIFLLPLIHAYTVNEWDSTNFQCNNYYYAISASEHICDKLIMCAYDGVTIGGGQVNCGGGCNQVKFLNDGSIYIYGSANWRLSATNPPTVCELGNCNIFFKCSGPIDCNLSDGVVYYASPNLYSGCATPKLSLFNSSVHSDRYSFSFGFDDVAGWADYYCDLTLNGITSTATRRIISNSSIDVYYADFPKQFTTANVLCTYEDYSNNSIIFVSLQNQLVDTSIPYGVKHVFYTPSILYPYSTLETITFEVLSNYDETPYPSAIHAVLSSPTDIDALNCSGSVNITRDLASAGQYTFSPNIICDNPAVIQFTITATDQASNEALGIYSFNATWDTGVMVIDNINLIKRITTGNLELWATVSNDYDKSPIPLEANLTCNYTIYSYNTDIGYSGGMEEEITYSHQPNAYFHVDQTDMKNQTVIAPTGYNKSNKFKVFIDCSADHYGNASSRSDRWIGNRRLLTFKCLEYENSASSPQLGLAYFSSYYNTNDILVRCTVIPDLDLTNANDTEMEVITILYSDLFGGENSIDLSTNIDKSFTFTGGQSNCIDPINGIPTYTDNPYTQTVIFKTQLHEKDDNCYNFVLLQPKKVSLDMVGFGMFSSGTNYLITNATITPTSSYITFDLVTLPKASVTNTTLAFVMNKTTNLNIIENGDKIVCITSINDPSSVVISVEHDYFDLDNPTYSCATQTVSKQAKGNSTYIYASYLQVNKTSCPFMALSNLTGHLVCRSTIYQLGQGAIEQLSNQVLYITPTIRNPKAQNPLQVFGLISDVKDMLLNPILGFLITSPLQFLLIILILLMVIVFFIAYSRFTEALRKSLGGE